MRASFDRVAKNGAHQPQEAVAEVSRIDPVFHTRQVMLNSLGSRCRRKKVNWAPVIQTSSRGQHPSLSGILVTQDACRLRKNLGKLPGSATLLGRKPILSLLRLFLPLKGAQAHADSLAERIAGRKNGNRID